MEKRTYSCTERSWDRTRQVHRLVFSIDCHTPTLPDLVSSWTLLRRRRRLRSSISSCRRVSPSRSCDASQCGKGIPSSVLLFSVFPPGCPRLDEQWANLRFKDLWLIQLSVISCTIYTACFRFKLSRHSQSGTGSRRKTKENPAALNRECSLTQHLCVLTQPLSIANSM